DQLLERDVVGHGGGLRVDGDGCIVDAPGRRRLSWVGVSRGEGVTMDYGVRWRHVRRAALLGAGIAAMLSVVGAVGLAVEGGWSLWSGVLLLVGWVVVPSLFALAVGVVALFRVRVRGNSVEHVFGGLLVLQRQPLSRFVRTDFAETAVVFEDGKRIRLG